MSVSGEEVFVPGSPHSSDHEEDNLERQREEPPVAAASEPASDPVDNPEENAEAKTSHDAPRSDGRPADENADVTAGDKFVSIAPPSSHAAPSHAAPSHAAPRHQPVAPPTPHVDLSGVTEPRVFVGGLPFMLPDAAVVQYFSQFGRVLECKVMRDRATGKSRGFGFILFDSLDGMCSPPPLPFCVWLHHLILSTVWRSSVCCVRLLADSFSRAPSFLDEPCVGRSHHSSQQSNQTKPATEVCPCFTVVVVHVCINSSDSNTCFMMGVGFRR